MNTKPIPVQFSSVDLLRALAIIMVFLYHTQTYLVNGYELNLNEGSWFAVNSHTELSKILWNLSPINFGWTGVELFLLISGFLIHYNTLSKGTVLWKDFFSRRFWRIYPTYLLVLVLVGIGVGGYGVKDWTYHALLIHNLDSNTFFSMNPSFWSLALEVQLYLVYPVLLAMRSKWGFRRTVWVIAVISLLSMMASHLFFSNAIHVSASLPRFWIVWTLGALIAERAFNGRNLFRNHGVWIVVLIILVPFVQFSVLKPYLLLYLVTIIHALFLEWVIGKGDRWKPGYSIFGKDIVWRLGRAIGISSYSFYLVHQPLLQFLHVQMSLSHLPLGWAMEVSVSFLCICLLSFGMYKCVELPSMRAGVLLRKKFSSGSGVSSSL